jgi:hypothetical protein
MSESLLCVVENATSTPSKATVATANETGRRHLLWLAAGGVSATELSVNKLADWTESAWIEAIASQDPSCRGRAFQI